MWVTDPPPVPHRLNEASLRRCQEEMSKLEDEASRGAEEAALLKEALERTQLQLSQEKRLLRATRLHKVSTWEPIGAHGGALGAKRPLTRGFKGRSPWAEGTSGFSEVLQGESAPML